MRHWITKLYKKAEKQGFALGAFNFSTSIILNGIVSAAANLKAPIIISTSEGERNFFGLEESVAVYHAIRKKYPNVILHADHTKSFQEVKRLVNAGYPSIHFDGSKLSCRHNIRETRKAVNYAHAHDVFIEGELGGITGGSTIHKKRLNNVLKEDILTDPEQAEEFLKVTGVDSIAISIGNAHGIWKDKPKLDFERLKKIKQRTGKFLVLHGGSGIPAKDIRKAISLGINKININTEIRVGFAHALLKGLHQREDYVPYHYLKDVGKAVSKVVKGNIITFKADKKV